MTSLQSFTLRPPHLAKRSAERRPPALLASAERLSNPDRRAAAMADWDRLAQRAAAPHFFLTSAWMQCWLARLSTAVPLWLLRVRRDGQDVGLAFVVKGPARRLGPLPFVPAWHLQATGTGLDSLCIEYNDLLVDPTEPQARGLLVEQWLRLGRGARELHLSHLAPPPAGQDWAATLQPPRQPLALRAHAKPSFSIDLQRVRDAGHDLLALRGAGLRGQVRRSMRAYAALGELRLEAAPDVATARQWFARMAVLHQQHWQGRGLPGAFAAAHFTAFHHALIDHCGTDPQRDTHVQLLRLTAGPHEVAYLYNLVHRGRVHFYQSGLDYGVGGKQARPGYVAHVLAAEHNARLGHAVYDFLMGESRYKRDLATDHGEMHSVVLQTPGWRFAAERVLRAWDGRRRAKGAIAPNAALSSPPDATATATTPAATGASSD